MEDHKVYGILNQNDQLRNLKFGKPDLSRHQHHYFNVSSRLFRHKQLKANIIISF